MTQRQSRPRNPASWHPAAPEREGLWIITRVRDFIDDIANTSPARLALSAFGAACLVFTFLLSPPIPSATGTATPTHQALFTAVSAVCVTGLTVVSTAVHWSFLGQLVILIGIVVGGLGTLTLASLLALMVSKKLGVRGKLIAQEAMNNACRLGEVGTLLRIVGLSTNLSAELPPSGIYVLTALMFSGRVGTVTLAAGLALRPRSQLYHYPEERPIIG
ncbi:hypothetical protein DQ354_15300 [Arthrobacter sp. AQ5-06]|nr:hypothetical protein DQ354_15300 [Arthrobacter sp. AQ5-06]